MFSPPRELGREAFSQAHSRRGPCTSKIRQGLQHGVVENHSGLLGVAWRAGAEGKGHFGEGETGSKKGSLNNVHISSIRSTFSSQYRALIRAPQVALES